MAKKVIMSKNAPKALGPYSHANEAAGFLFLSGMLGIDPASGTLEETVEAQATRAIGNIRAVLEESGLGLDAVVKTTVYVIDIKNFGAVNAVYQQHFTEKYPARTFIAVSALPAGALVEIEVIATRG